VRIEVVSGGIAPPGAPPFFDAFIAGSPVLWPGDAAGQAKVRAWREKLTAELDSSSRVRCRELGAQFTFDIEPHRMTTSDIDNFCIPAAQSLCAGIHGDMRHAPAMTALYAAKRAAAPNASVGVHVRAWDDALHPTIP